MRLAPTEIVFEIKFATSWQLKYNALLERSNALFQQNVCENPAKWQEKGVEGGKRRGWRSKIGGKRLNHGSIAMKSTKVTFASIDEYIALFPAKTRVLLAEMRKAIRDAAPEATEKISYQIPTFWWQGNLVHFAGYAKHIGFYPGAEAMHRFSKEFSQYKSAKGSVQFPLDEPLPLALVKKITKLRVKENTEKEKLKRAKGKAAKVKRG